MEIKANNSSLVICGNCKESKMESEIADGYGGKFCRKNCISLVANELVEWRIPNPELRQVVSNCFVKDVEEYFKYHNSMDDFNRFHSLQKSLDKSIFNLYQKK